MSEELFKDDKLAVAVKAAAADEIKRAYCALGWVLEDEYADGSYRDIIHMDFSRPHLIAGKDRLQLLQVRYEVALNFIARARRRVGARAAVIAALLIILGTALITFGAISVAFAPSGVLVGSGIALIISGAIFFFLAVYCCRLLYSRDRERYSSIVSILQANISSIISEAANITGVRYED